MDNRIHLKTIENFYKEKFGVEIEAKSFDNNKTGETYDVIYKKGLDVAFVYKMDDGSRFFSVDSDGKIIDGENIYGYVNAPVSTKENGTLVFSEQDLVLHYEYEIQDNEELIKREAELFPERTPIVLNGMFTRNGTTGAITTFYVDEIVHANEEQFDEICRGDDSEILKQYNEKTYDPITDGVHGILVIGPKGDGVMVDTSGYDYARYMSYAPKIEMPVNYILEQNMKRDAIYEMKVYVPLKVTRYDEDFEEEEIDGEPYMRDIRERVREFNREDGERGLAEYYSKDNISRNKVYSIRPDVERVRDVMMGVAVIKMTKPLTEPEIEDLKDYLTGQFADGWGESFEQRAIEVSGREIYVHYWDSHEYYIKTEEEMEQDFEQEQGMQGMGGMSGM